MPYKKGKLLMELVLCLVVLGIFGGFVAWQVLLGVEIAKNDPRDSEVNDRVVPALYFWLGGLPWMALISCFVYTVCLGIHKATGVELGEQYYTVHIFVCCVSTYFMLIAMVHAAPFDSLRKFVLNQEAVNGGSASTGCAAADPETGAITLDDTTTFFELVDIGWAPALETDNTTNTTIANKHPDSKEWQYILAPVVFFGAAYNGPRCHFDPPIFVLCAAERMDPRKVTRKDCGWDWTGVSPGPVTLRRTIGRSDWWGEEEWPFFPDPPNRTDGVSVEADRKQRLFDWQAPQLWEVEAEVNRVRKELADMHAHMFRVYGIFSLVYFVLLVGWVVYTIKDYWTEPSPRRNVVDLGVTARATQNTPQEEPLLAATRQVDAVSFGDMPQHNGNPLRQRYANDYLHGQTFANAVIEGCDIVNCVIRNSTIHKADFKGTCTLQNCFTSAVDVYGTLVVEGGRLRNGEVKPGGQLVGNGGCDIKDVVGYGGPSRQAY